MDCFKLWTLYAYRGSVEGMTDKSLNATAAALLGLLHDGAMTGGQLMAAAESRLGPFWTTTRSQVYRELPILAELGYVKTGKPGPRASQPYTVTAAGKKAFQRWMGQPTGKDQMRNPLLLRAAFGGLLTKAQLKAIYDEQAAERTERLNELKAAHRDAKAAKDNFAAATLEFAVTYQKALLKWLDSAPH